MPPSLEIRSSSQRMAALNSLGRWEVPHGAHEQQDQLVWQGPPVHNLNAISLPGQGELLICSAWDSPGFPLCPSPPPTLPKPAQRSRGWTSSALTGHISELLKAINIYSTFETDADVERQSPGGRGVWPGRGAPRGWWTVASKIPTGHPSWGSFGMALTLDKCQASVEALR